MADELERVIKSWVARNYGESEAEDPSWDIGDLSREIATKINKKGE